ncbi:MAG: Ig domain-containing protein [Clostridiales bacterium]|jgi:uncharacterized protein YjdB|nr:Ig domain-containing protein [Clostridiales bacterium]
MCRLKNTIIHIICVAITFAIIAATASGCSKKQPAPTQTPPPEQTPVITDPTPTTVPSEPGGIEIPSVPVETIRVTGLSISNETLNIHIGSSATLVISVEPKDATRKNVTWASGNSLIAEISEETNTTAKITGKSAGTVLITAVSEDGGKLAACIVTVSSPEPAVSVTKITLEPENPILTMGSTLKLVATVFPSNASTKSLTWSSSAPEVAMVSDDGLVSAIGVGTAVITAKAGNGNKTATCTVEVRDLSVPVTGVELNMDSATLKVGDFLVLTASVRPENATNKQINWTSSDRSVAAVNTAGEITAIGTGTATITASTSDGNIAATCRIEVIMGEISVERIELNTKSQYLKLGGSAKLKAEVHPKLPKKPPLIWTSSDDSIVSVSPGGEITAKAVGVATVTVSTEDGEHSATCSVIVSR